MDGQWASVFLANLHFAASSTNYLSSQRPPSPLQNFWSLAVEEQFYLVYPTVFFVVARTYRQISLRVRLTAALGLIIAASYALSIVMTANNPASAFFSPLTRAWELAIGALIAVATDRFRHIPAVLAAVLSWLGLALILYAAFVFTSATPYPGSLVAVPVLGAALIVTGGSAQPTWGVESLLRRRPLQLLGIVSYSLYLWHWPILTIATQEQGKTALPVGQGLMWILLSLAFAVATYFALENPVRHARLLISSKWASVLMGGLLILASLVVTTFETGTGSGADESALALAHAASGSPCPQPTQEQVTSLRATIGGSSDLPTTSNPMRILVVGDSTACTLLPGLVAVAPTYGVRVEDASVIGCGVVSGQIAPSFDDGVNVEQFTNDCQAKALAAEQAGLKLGNPNVIIWSSSFEKDSIVVNSSAGQKVLISGTPEWQSTIKKRIEQRIDLLRSTGATIVILLQPPEVNPGNPKHPTASDADFARFNDLLLQVAASDPSHVRVVNLESKVCPSGPPCPYIVDGMPIRPDDMHYSSKGSLWVSEWLMPRILAAART